MCKNSDISGKHSLQTRRIRSVSEDNVEEEDSSFFPSPMSPMMTTQNQEDGDELLKEELLVSKTHPNHDARIVAIQLDEITKDASYSGDTRKQTV